ncbi:hypothetical protein L1987_76554 [Smallanthus sonchifolius]|uniref:Uncharacterized protein n=1 Tax=Smallanthus sonchifolius TaxID=185202 RepID=A0ACB8Z6I9_9ASTR|nr:hypothetical protein L1987_76554 [Smallanthus sonchifolius]
MLDQLHRVVGTRHYICTSSPQGMYPKPVANPIPYSELLRLFSRDWLDVSVMHSFAIDRWTLLIFEPSTGSAYIVDSLKKRKSKDSYAISDLVVRGFEREFIWIVTNCNQQRKEWECGFMVIKHMREFVETIQHDFIKTLWNTNEITSHEELEIMIVELMKHWIKKVFDV